MKLILLSAAAAFAFVHLIPKPKFMLVKPLNCHTCLSFWICLWSMLAVGFRVNDIELYFYPFAAMSVSQFIYLIFKRL